MKKGSWEAIFGHLGTPEEVAEEWLNMQDEIAKLKEELTACKAQEWKRRHLSDEGELCQDKSLQNQLRRLSTGSELSSKTGGRAFKTALDEALRDGWTIEQIAVNSASNYWMGIVGRAH